MKKTNQAPNQEAKTTQKLAQSKAARRRIKVIVPSVLKRKLITGATRAKVSLTKFCEAAIREKLQQKKGFEQLLIPDYRLDQIISLADRLGADAGFLAERAINSYLDFVEQYPQLAQTQPRFVHGASVLVVQPTVFERLDYLCVMFDLDRTSVADSALRVYIRRAEHSAIDFELAKADPGGIDVEQIAYLLSQATSPAQCMFAKVANHYSNQDFEGACGDLGALRELVMYHPDLQREREALEMIVEGANRLWASPAQQNWREVRPLSFQIAPARTP